MQKLLKCLNKNLLWISLLCFITVLSGCSDESTQSTVSSVSESVTVNVSVSTSDEEISTVDIIEYTEKPEYIPITPEQIASGQYTLPIEVILSDTGLIKSMYGDFGDVLCKNSEEATAFVEAYAKLLGLSEDFNVILSDTFVTTDCTNYLFETTCNSVIIESDSITLTVNNENKPCSLVANITPVSPLPADFAMVPDTDAIKSFLNEYYKTDLLEYEYIDSRFIDEKILDEILISYEEEPILFLLFDSSSMSIVSEISAYNSLTVEACKATGIDEAGNSISIDISKEGDKYVLADYSRNIFIYRMNDKGKYEKVEADSPSFSEEYAVEAETLKYMQEIYDYYLDTFGIESYDGKGSEIRIYTNATESGILGIDISHYNNAAWNALSEKIVVGQKSGIYKYSAANDISSLAHEYGHAVSNELLGRNGLKSIAKSAGVAFTDGPDYYNGICEAYADILGCLSTNSEDWIIGKNYVNEGLTINWEPCDGEITNGTEQLYARDLNSITKNVYSTHQYGEDPSVLSEDSMDLDGHYLCVLLGHVACRMNESGYFTNEEMSRIFMKSLQYGYSVKSTFSDFRANVLRAVYDEGFGEEELRFVIDEFEKVGITGPENVIASDGMSVNLGIETSIVLAGEDLGSLGKSLANLNADDLFIIINGVTYRFGRSQYWEVAKNFKDCDELGIKRRIGTDSFTCESTSEMPPVKADKGCVFEIYPQYYVYDDNGHRKYAYQGYLDFGFENVKDYDVSIYDTTLMGIKIGQLGKELPAFFSFAFLGKIGPDSSYDELQTIFGTPSSLNKNKAGISYAEWKNITIKDGTLEVYANFSNGSLKGLVILAKTEDYSGNIYW